MTEKQKVFADEYLIDLNGTRAYKAAYKTCRKDETAATNAGRLLRNAEVKTYIDEQLEKMHDQRIAKAEDVMIYLSDVMNGKSTSSVLAMCGDGMQAVIEKPPDEKEKLKAAELLGRRYGMWSEKIEVKNEGEEQKQKSISNIESLVKQMIEVQDDDISD